MENLLLSLLLLVALPYIKDTASENVGVNFVSSPNIGEGDTAVYNCSTNNSSVTITWYLNKTVPATTLVSYGVTTPGTGSPVSSLIIPGLVNPFNNTEVLCYASGPGFGDVSPPSVILRIQGRPGLIANLLVQSSSSCCYHFKWSPPFTLPGVPILGYNINVTNNINETIFQTVVNTTQLEYCPVEFGDYYHYIGIAAVNSAGEGVEHTDPLKRLNATKFNITSTELKEQYVDKRQNWAITLLIEIDLLNSELSNFIRCIDKVSLQCTDDPDLSYNTTNITVTSKISAIFHISSTMKDKRHNIAAHIHYSNNVKVSHDTLQISFFDVNGFRILSNESNDVSFMCLFVRGSQALGCYVLMIEATTGMNYSTLISRQNVSGSIPGFVKPGVYDISIYDINSDGSMSSVPALISDVIIESITTSSMMPIMPSSDIITPSTIINEPSNDKSNNAITIAVVFAVILSLLIVITLIGLTVIMIIKRQKKQAKSDMIAKNDVKVNKIIPKLNYINVEAVPNPPAVPPTDNPRPKYSTINFDHETIEQTEGIYNVLTRSEKILASPVPESNSLYSALKHSETSTISHDETVPCLLTKRELTNKDLSIHVAPHLTKKWREVGSGLALTPPQLDDIEENRQGISDVFHIWEECKTRPFTWDTLLTVLRSSVVNEPGLATTLEACS